MGSVRQLVKESSGLGEGVTFRLHLLSLGSGAGLNTIFQTVLDPDEGITVGTISAVGGITTESLPSDGGITVDSITPAEGITETTITPVGGITPV